MCQGASQPTSSSWWVVVVCHSWPGMQWWQRTCLLAYSLGVRAHRVWQHRLVRYSSVIIGSVVCRWIRGTSANHVTAPLRARISRFRMIAVAMISAKVMPTHWLVLTKQKLTKSSGNMVPPSKPQRSSWADFRKQLPVALIPGVWVRTCLRTYMCECVSGRLWRRELG